MDPDGKYLIKGGGREVWKRFRFYPMIYSSRLCARLAGSSSLAGQSDY
jgi:hypothetical protein